jgi:hypothetical protein
MQAFLNTLKDICTAVGAASLITSLIVVVLALLYHKLHPHISDWEDIEQEQALRKANNQKR